MKFKLKSDSKKQIRLNMDAIQAYVSRHKPMTEFEFSITRRKEITLASKNQRSFYFGYILPPFMEELGYDPEDTEQFHLYAKVTFFQNDPDFKITQDDRGIWHGVPSVFSLDPDIGDGKRRKFIDWILRRAAYEGVYIEDPK